MSNIKEVDSCHTRFQKSIFKELEEIGIRNKISWNGKRTIQNKEYFFPTARFVRDKDGLIFNQYKFQRK